MKDSAKNTLFLLVVAAVFIGAYFLPFERISDVSTLQRSGRESLLMLQDYARNHVLLCLIPAFFIAGGVSVFVSQGSVLKYFGSRANKVLAYSVASVSGGILTICSCTILPLFASIYGRGAGIGPATTFLYSGPAINVLALILTARVLGWELGAVRAVTAVLFGIVIGLLMHLIFRKDEQASVANGDPATLDEEQIKPLWMNVLYFGAMVGILVFANWEKPQQTSGFWHAVWSIKWTAVGVLSVLLTAMLWRWFRGDELKDWTTSSWGFAKEILPLLCIGVLVAGLLLGRPGHPALVPDSWVQGAVGGNSPGANLLASVAGALMYFATCTEVPILQGLMGAGMGKGPALALLLAGPALSLPNMLVIRTVIGTRKTLVYVTLVMMLSTAAGMLYGWVAG